MVDGVESPARRKWLSGHCSAWLLVIGTAGLMPAAARAQAAAPVVLVVGDSLSAEYGLARGSGWVALLEQRLAKEKITATVVNASISGDTTSGGRTRLPALLKQHRPAIVILELGANDALRGLPLAMTKTNLAEMAQASKVAGAQVLLVGMQVPPNYGKQYSDQFAALFAEVAKEEGSALAPFLLAGVADAPDAASMFQPDHIHPLAAAHPRMLENVWAGLRPLLKTGVAKARAPASTNPR